VKVIVYGEPKLTRAFARGIRGPEVRTMEDATRDQVDSAILSRSPIKTLVVCLCTREDAVYALERFAASTRGFEDVIVMEVK